MTELDKCRPLIISALNLAILKKIIKLNQINALDFKPKPQNAHKCIKSSYGLCITALTTQQIKCYSPVSKQNSTLSQQAHVFSKHDIFTAVSRGRSVQ